MVTRQQTEAYPTSTLIAQFGRLPATARFYSVLSVLVIVLAVTSGLTLHKVVSGDPVGLNPRTPIFGTLSPWGRVMNQGGSDYLKASFDVLGVVTPIPGEAQSFQHMAAAGEGLEVIAASHGIDLDLLASANGASYAQVPRRETEVRLPLLYSRDRSWDRSLEFLYPISTEAPIGGNGKAKQGAPIIVRHAVARGECLWNIARKYHVKMETIIAMNDLPSARYLRPGQILEIPDTDGTYINIKKGDTISGVCKKYTVELTDLVNANPGVDVQALHIGQKLFVPGTEALGQLFRFGWPVHGRISGRFGNRFHPIFHRRMMHNGLDIAAPSGTPIRAALSGRVVSAGWNGGLGRAVVIEHPNGYETTYGHCSKILVKKGQTVKKGEQIAKVGSTGIASGPHIHFEVRQNRKRMNPERVLY